MVLSQCDACGKIFVVKDRVSWNPNIYYFTTFDFCDECYKKYQENLEDMFHKCNHDMKVFLPKQVEVAKAMCTGGKKKK